MFARTMAAALLTVVMFTAAPTAIAQQTAAPSSWATLPLMTKEAEETAAGLRGLTSNEQLAWLWARGLKAMEAADLAGRTWREIRDGVETVIFFRKDSLAFVRTTPDQPGAAPDVRWEVRDGVVVFPDGGEARRFVADSKKLSGWTLSEDGRRIGRFELVYRDGNLTSEKNEVVPVPRTVG